MPDIFLLLGSNLGNRETILSQARKIAEQKLGRIVRMSSLYLTESWGKIEQPDFINQVVVVKSDLKPREVLEEILSIEEQLGRQRIEKWGSRTIDIDILFYDDVCINEPDLVIPHPYLHQRKFTLEPLMELEPELKHPVFNKSIAELYNNLTDNLKVQRLTPHI